MYRIRLILDMLAFLTTNKASEKNVTQKSSELASLFCLEKKCKTLYIKIVFPIT